MLNWKQWSITWVQPLTVGLLLASSAAARAQTVKYFAWTTNSAECAPEMSGEDTPAQDNVCSAWHDKLVDKGFSSAGYLTNNGVNLDRFCDPDWSPSGDSSDCADHSKGVDEATAQMICIHGISSGGHWEGLLYDSGTSGETCLANSASDFHVGDYNTDFLHLWSCHSLDDGDDAGNLEIMGDTLDTRDQFLHLITGFHGLSTSSSSWAKRVKKLAKKGFDGAIGELWVDLMYDRWRWSLSEEAGVETCPVAMGAGATSSEANGHISDDTYDDRGSDPSAASVSAVSTNIGCDPADADPYGG